MNLHTIFLRYVLQLQDEIAMSQVRHLASPTLCHSLQVQILQANQVVSLAQFVSQLPLEIGTFVHDISIQSLQLQLLALAVVAAFLALREVARLAPKLLQVSFKELRVVNLTPITQSHVLLQSEVDAHGCTIV